jgi:hypothetical protein
MMRKIKYEHNLLNLLKLLKLEKDIEKVTRLETPQLRPTSDGVAASDMHRTEIVPYITDSVTGKYDVEKLDDGIFFKIKIEKVTHAPNDSRMISLVEWKTEGKLNFSQ